MAGPDLTFDATHAHKDVSISADGKTFRNWTADDAPEPVPLNSRLQKYKGAISSRGLQHPGRFLYDMNVEFKVKKPLDKSNLVFEIGIARKSAIGTKLVVSGEKHAMVNDCCSPHRLRCHLPPHRERKPHPVPHKTGWQQNRKLSEEDLLLHLGYQLCPLENTRWHCRKSTLRHWRGWFIWAFVSCCCWIQSQKCRSRRDTCHWYKEEVTIQWTVHCMTMFSVENFELLDCP